MKVRGIGVPGGPEALHEFDVPEPHAGAGEVRVRVRAAGVNPVDTLLRAGGISDPRARPPHVPGMDAAGVVDELGPDSSWSIGDEVMVFAQPLTPYGGAYVQHLVSRSDAIAAVPLGASLDEASTLPMNGLTALQIIELLQGHGAKTIGLTGAAGTLGGYVIALAKDRGLTVVADTAPSDADRLRGYGVDHLVERGPGVAARMREIVPVGVDGLVDAAVLNAAAVPAVADDGIFISVRRWSSVPTRRIFFTSSAVAKEYLVPGRLDVVRRAAEVGVLVPRVVEVLPAADAALAHERLERSGLRGRLVLRF